MKFGSISPLLGSSPSIVLLLHPIYTAMDVFSTHSSGTKTLNTSQENPLHVSTAKSHSQTHTSRHLGRFHIKKTYEPHIDEDRFREKRVFPTQKRAAKRAKSALLIQKVFRGYRVRSWLRRNERSLGVMKRILRGGRLAVRLREEQCR